MSATVRVRLRDMGRARLRGFVLESVSALGIRVARFKGLYLARVRVSLRVQSGVRSGSNVVGVDVLRAAVLTMVFRAS